MRTSSLGPFCIRLRAFSRWLGPPPLSGNGTRCAWKLYYINCNKYVDMHIIRLRFVLNCTILIGNKHKILRSPSKLHIIRFQNILRLFLLFSRILTPFLICYMLDPRLLNIVFSVRQKHFCLYKNRAFNFYET